MGEKAEKNLSEKEIFIIKEMVGFDDDVPKNFQEIADKLNTSRQRVRQVEVTAVEKLRRYFKRHRHIHHNYATLS